ncbi:unnamed protein product [Arabis nemorensis]|uniref:Uncharacterized protein n=1 Tax=Arabis nemorensis TaxID=586526 RepID=A0A565CCF3_9BRAS|nr:unnamed protein product [Arabis nemorensis]
MKPRPLLRISYSLHQYDSTFESLLKSTFHTQNYRNFRARAVASSTSRLDHNPKYALEPYNFTPPFIIPQYPSYFTNLVNILGVEDSSGYCEVPD